jgi:hypothetical protein
MEKNKFEEKDKLSSMTEDRIQALEKLGFEWAKRKGEESWNASYKELCEYHKKHGHADVPTKYKENKALGRWVSTQRSQYKQWKSTEKTQMTEERHQKLCEIDFMFVKLNPKPKTQVVVDREEVDGRVIHEAEEELDARSKTNFAN